MENFSLLPENWREIIARNIFNERERLNLNQRQLSEHLNKKDPTTISKWENAEGTFNLEVLMGLCKLFGRTPNDLLCKDLAYIEPPPKNGKRYTLNTEGVGEAATKEEEELIIEMDVGGAISANESPPIKKEDIKKMRQDLLKMMQKLETIDSE